MKKIENFIFKLCLVVIVCLIVIAKPLSNLDEVWNFNIARCISSGLVPYRDISMVSTPLLGFLLAIPLKLFGTEIFYTRIFAIINILIVFILMYKILDILEVRREISNIVVGVALAVIAGAITIDYNILSLTFVLSIVILELKCITARNWNKWFVNVIIGIFAGFTICSKQSIGLIIGLIVVVSPFYFTKKKVDIVPIAKNMLYRAIGIVIPVGILCIYLAVNNAFGEFLSYSIKGVKTFSNSIPYTELLQNGSSGGLAVMVLLIMIACVIATIALKVKKKEDGKLFLLTVYSLGMFSIVIPIADIRHFSIGIMPCYILLAYAVMAILRNIKLNGKINFKHELEFISIVTLASILVCVFCLEFENNERLGEISKYDYQKHFRYVYISPELNKEINLINEYASVKERTLYILDVSAAVYMIPVDRYNKNYDMFRIGSLGSGGEDAIIEKIKSEDSLYLIKNDESKINWQNPSKIRAYIKENMELVDSKGSFDVYRNKNTE